VPDCREFPGVSGTFHHKGDIFSMGPYIMKKVFITSMTTYLQSSSEPVTDAVAFFMGNSARVWKSSYTYSSWQDKAMDSMRGWRKFVEEGGDEIPAPPDSEVESEAGSSQESDYQETDEEEGAAEDEWDDEEAANLDVNDDSEVSEEEDEERDLEVDIE